MDQCDEVNVKVPFGAKFLDAALCLPASLKDARTAMILTHGAGGDMNARHLRSLAHASASAGLICLRFTCKSLNLGYRVKAFRSVWNYLKTLQTFTIKHTFVGGRSMGCRAAVALARQLSVEEPEEVPRGVLCLAFPLHPPGRPTHRQRSEDLRALPQHLPVLFVSGTEDQMCDTVLFEEMVKELKGSVDVFWLRGGSHGLTVKGRTEDSVIEEVNSQVLTWLSEHSV